MQVKEENGNYICLKHNQIIKMVVIDDNVPPDNQLLCLTCLELNRSPYKIIGIGQAQEMIKEALNKQNEGNQETMKEKLNQLTNLQLTIEQLRSSILSSIDAVNKLLQSWTTDLTNQIKKDQSIDLINGLQYLKSDKAETNNNIAENEQIYLFKLLSAFKKLMEKNGFQQCFIQVSQLLQKREKKQQQEQEQIETKQSLQNQIQIQESTQLIKDRPIIYKELNQFKFKQFSMCRCLCFNKQNNILAVGCNSNIQIFEFENGKLTEIQQLKGHTSIANVIYICQNNEIFSCSQDQTIKRWIYYNNNKQWILAEEFKEHNNEIMCLIMNQAEDAFFTSSCDDTIKYWIKSQQKWKFIQTFGQKSFSLSLNESETLLLSNNQTIFKQDQNNQWVLNQQLDSQDRALRASFIGENMIACQLWNKGILRIYENNKQNFKFIIKTEIKVQDGNECWYFFPQIFCKQLRILINKHNQFINIIRFKKDNSIVVDQIIEFKTQQLYGTLTGDGQYLVTYDKYQNQFEIRQLQ